MQKDANLVELEKCCRTHIFLQNFVLIQPRTSPPKNCKIFEKCIFRRFGGLDRDLNEASVDANSASAGAANEEKDFDQESRRANGLVRAGCSSSKFARIFFQQLLLTFVQTFRKPYSEKINTLLCEISGDL